MTGQEALRRGTIALRAAAIDDPEIEAALLLRHAIGRDRVYLYSHLPEELALEQEQAYLDILGRRVHHRPAAYLTGMREFYGIEFYVAPGVLIPRPETELLVEQSLQQLRHRASSEQVPVFADIGTGSGAVAVAVAKHWAAARYFAVDRSQGALEIARLNARRPRLAGRIEFLLGDLMAPLPVPADVVAANLPYVTTADWEQLPPEIRLHEPREALDGGADGLDVIRRLIATAPARLSSDGVLLIEIGRGQADPVLSLLADSFPAGRRYLLADLAGIERVAVVDLGGAELPQHVILR
jgi:release factor glutamine methyltransferase